MISRSIAIGFLFISPAVFPSFSRAESPAEVQDVWFLHPRGLLNVQLEILRDGQGYQAAWGEYLWELFEELDTDGSFDLDFQEFRRGDWTRFRERNPTTGYTIAADRSFLDFDSNPPDERISFTEVLETLGQSCCQASFGGQTNPSRSDTADALFAVLDHNQNEELDHDEMSGAFNSLRQLDRNDDELYSASELKPEDNPIQGGGALSFAFQVTSAPRQDSQRIPVITPPPATPADVLGGYIIGFYDRPANQDGDAASQPEAATLSREEFKVPDSVFDAIDINRNGELDIAEITAWLSTRDPDVAITVRLEGGLETTERLEVTSAKEIAVGPLTVRVEKTESGDVRISVPSTQVVIAAAGPRDIEQELEAEKNNFKRVDGDNNDYLDDNEARQLGITSDFARMDTDHDGQLFFEELAEYRRHEADLASRRNDLAITSRGSSLYEIVESDRNQLLSARELSRLEEITSGWDFDDNDALAMDEIPRRYQLSIQPGAPNSRRLTAVPVDLLAGASAGNPNDPKDTRLKWFARMDRNNDGDLSPREFLGPREDFTRLDTDNDRLISQEEAKVLDSE